LRIVVADDEQDMRDYLSDLLPELGHIVLAAAETGAELLRCCRQHRPDLIITDVRMPDGDGLSIAKQFAMEHFTPVIVITAFHDATVLKQATDTHVFAYLVKPIERAHLEAALAMAWTRFQQFGRLREEADSLRQALEDRKIIEKAKGILMKQRGLEEEEAFRRLQKLARNENKKLAEIARIIVLAQRALDG
jgi:response regulator NasT